MDTSIKVKYKQDQKKLIVEVEDLAFMTPFQPTLIGEILTKICDVLEKNNKYEFQYFKDDKKTFGWKSSIKKETED